MATTNPSSKATAEEVKSDFDEIKEHLTAIFDSLTALKTATGKLAAGQAKAQLRRASDFADSASGKVADYRDLAIDKVKERPLAAIGAAALAGFLIASLRKR